VSSDPICPACGAPRPDHAALCPSCGARESTGSLPEHRLLELIAEARKIAGEEGPIVVEPSSTPAAEVYTGNGLRFAGHAASRYFLASAERYRERFAGRPYAQQEEADDKKLVADVRDEALVLTRTQLVQLSGGGADREALVPLLQRTSVRGNGICAVGFAFDDELLGELLARHLSGEVCCPAFRVSLSERAALRRLTFRHTTGFFGERAAAVSVFFDHIEMHDDELLLVYHGGAGRGLPPAARIVIGRSDRASTATAVSAVRRLLRSAR